MLTALRGGALWAAVVIMLAVIGACTALAYNGTLTGELWLSVITPIIVAVTGVTAAHVAGNQTTAALLTPPPVSGATLPPPPAPAPNVTVGTPPAMPNTAT